MLRYHYCQAYTNSVSTQIDKAIRKVLEEYSNQESLKGIGKISSFTGGVYVLKIKNPYVEVILEEKKNLNGNKNSTVYFVRGFKNGLQDYVEIRDGKWLIYNPLPESEIDNFHTGLENHSIGELNKEQPPIELLNWQNEYELRVHYDIYETESWVKFAFSTSIESGMKEDEAKLYRLVLLEIFKTKLSIETEIIATSENEEILAVNFNEVGIVFSKINIDSQLIYLLHNGANVKTQNDHWEKIKKIENFRLGIYKTIKDISSVALKAYPNWVLNEADLWAKIEKNNEMGNLSLLPEQTEFLKSFKFPKYINGQAGSGKSTMLYYLFANAYYFKYAGVIKGDIIFLTENEKLLKHTKKSVFDLLLFNPEFDLSSEDIAITNVEKHFYPLKQFLLNLLPTNDKKFRQENYLNFSKFKHLYELSNIPNYTKSKYSAELVWFTLSTYVYGNDLNYHITSENYEEKMPKEGKEIISYENFVGIEKDVIKPFYEKLLNEDGYWDKIKLIKYLNENTEIQKRYDIIFCDEAQDFSRVELEFILKLSVYTQYNLINVEQFPVVFAGDALQTVNPTGFRSEVLTSMIYNELTNKAIGFKLDPTQLEFTPTYNYRSSQAIVNVANAIQYYRKKELGADIKYFQTSKRPVLFENEHLNVFVEFETFNNNPELQQKVEFKTIILPVNSDEIESYKHNNPILQKFNNIISAVDAKGIDFSEVVVYGFGDFKDKNKLEGYENSFFFNKLYVAVTRAQSELVIIDSERAKDFFWKELIERYVSSESANVISLGLKEFNDIIIFDSNEIIQSSSDVVENDAIRQKEQGILERNIALLQVASSHFIKIDNKKQYYLCLGEIEEIREDWAKAANFYLKKEVGNEGLEKSANVYWNAGLWDELIKLSKSLKNNDQQLRNIIAKYFSENILEVLDIKILIENIDKFKILLDKTSWRKSLIEKLLKTLELKFVSDEFICMADLLELICAKCDKIVWDTLGKKYFKLKKYDSAVNAFEMIGHEGQFFLKSKLEIAKRKNDLEEIIIFLGRIAIETKANKFELSSEIIYYYKNNAAVLDKSKNLYIKLYVYFAHLLTKSDEVILVEFAKQVENMFSNRKTELAESYFNLLKFSGIGKPFINFVIDRWVKTQYSSGVSLEIINKAYEKVAFDNEINYEAFMDSDISEIPIVPYKIIGKFPDHFRNVHFKNFRKFEDVSINNIGLFNIVVGDNNIGKTSLLEAFLFTPDKKEYLERVAFAFIERSNIHPDKQENSNDVQYFYKIKKDFVHDFLNTQSNKEGIEFNLSEKRNSWHYEVYFEDNLLPGNKNDLLVYTDEDYNILKDLPYSFCIKQPFMPYGKGFSRDLAQIYFDDIINNSDSKIEQEFLSNVSLFIPNIQNITANPKDGAINIRNTESPHQLRPLHQYGEGANKLFRILILLTLHRGKRLMIDEIDAGIHYSRFKEFWKIILVIAFKDKTQIIATTHNDECIHYFKEVLEELGKEYQNESRVIQMKLVNNVKIRSFEYKSFDLAIEDGIELRGGDNL